MNNESIDIKFRVVDSIITQLNESNKTRNKIIKIVSADNNVIQYGVGIIMDELIKTYKEEIDRSSSGRHLIDTDNIINTYKDRISRLSRQSS